MSHKDCHSTYFTLKTFCLVEQQKVTQKNIWKSNITHYCNMFDSMLTINTGKICRTKTSSVISLLYTPNRFSVFNERFFCPMMYAEQNTWDMCSGNNIISSLATRSYYRSSRWMRTTGKQFGLQHFYIQGELQVIIVTASYFFSVHLFAYFLQKFCRTRRITMGYSWLFFFQFKVLKQCQNVTVSESVCISLLPF